MRLLGYILILTIFSSSMQMGKAWSSMKSLLVESSISMSCCSSTAALDADNMDCKSQQEEDDCCTDASCDCTCCHHVVFYIFFERAFAQKENYKNQVPAWTFSYYKDFEQGVFHPPLV